MLHRASPIPLYHQLAELLMADIRGGVYRPGERIPSETELAQTHAIGRPTARQAIDALVRKGLVVRRRGAGTFVAERREAVDLFSLGGTMASLSGSGREAATEVTVSPRRIAVGNGQADNPFTGGEAVCLQRVSSLDGEPVLVEDIYLDPDLFAGLVGMDLRGRSLSRIVEEHFHLELEHGEQAFRIAYAGEADTLPGTHLPELLKLSKQSPILAVSRLLHFAGAPGAIYSALYCRTDRFVFTQIIGGRTHG